MLVRVTYSPMFTFALPSLLVFCHHHFATTTLVKVASDLHLAMSRGQFSDLLCGDLSTALGMEDYSFFFVLIF